MKVQDIRESERLRALRNLNPHRAARAAMWLWGKRYSQQRGGSMDFWDSLSESEKRTARRMAAEIVASPEEPS